MQQGVMLGGKYIGHIEQGPYTGRFIVQSTVTATSGAYRTYSEALHYLVTVARACGMQGEVRTPEHLMGLR